MITLMSAFVGFLSAALPEFLALFREQKDKKHELALLELQLAYDREKLAMGHGARLEEIRVAAENNEHHALNKRMQRTGVAWVDALGGTVRPVITYLFFLLYACVKIAQWRLLVVPSLPWHEPLTSAQALVIIWTADDMALFTAIIAFWFGQRAISKFRLGAH
jgi:hypothetical protein